MKNLKKITTLILCLTFNLVALSLYTNSNNSNIKINTISASAKTKPIIIPSKYVKIEQKSASFIKARISLSKSLNKAYKKEKLALFVAKDKSFKKVISQTKYSTSRYVKVGKLLQKTTYYLCVKAKGASCKIKGISTKTAGVNFKKFTTLAKKTNNSNTPNTDNTPKSSVEVGYLDNDQGFYKTASLELAAAPARDSLEQAKDSAFAKQMWNLEGSDRWIQSSVDGNDLTDNSRKTERPVGCSQFNCQLGINVSETLTPTIVRILQKIAVDSSKAAKVAKDTYNRKRPFDVLGSENNETCRPQDDSFLKSNGSYPSGHTTKGWLWGYALSQVDSADKEKILQRAKSYGESRLLCNVHWYTDVQAGEKLASFVFARVEKTKEFKADVAQAKKEFLAQKNNKNAKAVTKDWTATLDSLANFVKDNPDNAQAKKALKELEPLKDWSCNKEEQAIKNFDIKNYTW